jgi:hypothetical protein
MDSKSKILLNDLESLLNWASQSSTSMVRQISEMQEVLSDYRFQCDDIPLDKKPVVLFSGAYPWQTSELLSKVERMNDLISVKDMVDFGIYNSKTTLNKKLCDGSIPDEVYLETGNRRFFIKEKLLEYINDNFS